jgi:DNA-binding response OmpR family regulator
MSRRLQILVVEDYAPLREQIVTLLTRAGHVVEEASDGRLALQIALGSSPDVVLLDLGLPGLDGINVCEKLRAQSGRHLPILMLTARDTLTDKLNGFAAGADDYLVKPFASDELLARIAALSKRPGIGQDYLVRIGSLELDRRSRSVTRNQIPLELAPTAFSILLMLVEAWPRAVSRSDIIEKLWDGESPESDALRTHIFQLRRKLDKSFATPMLKTVHGVGFRLESDTGPPPVHSNAG